MSLKSVFPLVHAVDLMLVLSLTGTLGKVALGPFTESAKCGCWACTPMCSYLHGEVCHSFVDPLVIDISVTVFLETKALSLLEANISQFM